MPDVKIKGYSGEYFFYDAVPKVWLEAEESTEENPLLVPFTHGELLDGVEIPLDFSAGDRQTVSVPDGYLVKEAAILKPENLVPGNIKSGETVCGVTGEFLGDTEELTVDLNMADGDQIILPSADGKVISKATVQKPANLIPENIAEGVDIAGIIGTLAGGVSNICIATFTAGYSYEATTSAVTLIPKDDLDKIGFGSASNKFAIMFVAGRAISMYPYYMPLCIFQTTYSVSPIYGSMECYGNRTCNYKSSSTATTENISTTNITSDRLSGSDPGWMRYNDNGLQYYGGSQFPLYDNTYFIIAGVIS